MKILGSCDQFEQNGSMAKLLWGYVDQFEQISHGQERD
jgi:hypothetical protein